MHESTLVKSPWVVVILLSGFLAFGGCSNVVPVVNVTDTSVPDGMDLAEVKRSIMEGCGARGWACKDIDDSTIQGSVWVRGKHFAQVNIDYSEESYSINFSDSKELDYDYEKNKIHKNYNSWVMNLNGDIMNALLRNSN